MLIAKEKPKAGVPAPQGTITTDIALMVSKRIKGPERAVALAKAIAQEGVSEHVGRNIVREAARCPGEAIPRIIKRVLETAPELKFTPEHAEIVRMGAQSQVTLTKIDPRIRAGQTVDLYTKFAVVKVTSVDKKALRDFTEENAQAEGGYSLEHFKTNWKQRNTVWNPRQKVFCVNFEVEKLVTAGKGK